MSDIALERAALALFVEALERPEAERAAFVAERTAGDGALLQRVSALMRAGDIMMQTGGATDDLDEEPPPVRIGAYRIVERVGRGGMGSVYRGERDTGDFEHVVAIKIIKPGLLSETLIDRFHRERRLLAGLVHPNIARLYDGGETAAGSPYFIMEYVDGLPLLAWAETHAADDAQRARLFTDTCTAVAFAHQNLVIHRDLTPSNVMVTDNATVKLIDFGIARPPENEADTDAEPVSIVSLSLTPGYAAPERMTTSAVTTATDIYSLGRVLAELFPGAARDRDFAAIVACATAKDPQDRYASAGVLGDDVRSWRGGLPVAARRGGMRYRTGKFLRRHWVASALATASILVLIAALFVTLLANAQAVSAREEAEQRFQQTRAIARTLLFESWDEVSRVPGSTRARMHLARQGLTYLEALADQVEAPLDVRLEVAQGYLRLAQVTGGGQASQLGRYADTDALLARADQILAPLLADNPDEPSVRLVMAALRNEQSAVNLYNNNRTDLARRQAQEARALAGDPGAGIDAARLHADARRAEADVLLWDEDYAGARQLLLGVESFIRGLPEAAQRDPRLMSIRGGSLRLLGEALHRLQDVAGARRALDDAVAVNRALSDAEPDDPLRRRRLIAALRYRAIVHRSNDRSEPARESIEEAARYARQLRDRDPNDAGALQLVTVISEVQAQILGDLGRYPESFAVGAEVRAAHERLVALAGGAAGARRNMAQALRTDGGNHYNGRDYAGACRIWADAIAIFADLDRRGVLTESDRIRGYPDVRNYVARACGPPRAGLGDEM